MSVEDSSPRLLLTDAEGTHAHLLLRFPFTLGRSTDSDLCLAHAQVSRQHAAIEQEPDGLYLRDLGSRHGTLRNGERISRARLRAGDRIALGHATVKILFLDDASDAKGGGPNPAAGFGDTTLSLLERVSSSAGGSDLEKLSLFLEAAQRFSGTHLLDEVLQTSIEYALRVTNAERGFVFLGETPTSLRLRIGRDCDGAALTDDSKISRSMVRDAAYSGLDYVLGDATGDGAAIGRDSIIAHDLRSVITIPLRRRNNGMLLGVLYLDSRLQTCNLSTVSRDILHAIAIETATLLENARMLEAEQAAAMLRKEMEIAAGIQHRIIASELPSIPGFALDARTVPCAEVGGDFYDVIPTAEGCVAIIADVSGKGMSAALLASIVQGMMYAQITSGASLVDAVSAVNTFLCARVSGEKYLTMVAVRCGTDGTAELVNCGHVPPMVVTADRTVHIIEDGDPPVGMFTWASFHAVPLALPPGGRLVLVSDGVSESEDPAGEQFTLEQFASCLAAQDPIAAVFERVHHFSEGLPQADDRTMVVIDRLSIDQANAHA